MKVYNKKSLFWVSICILIVAVAFGIVGIKLVNDAIELLNGSYTLDSFFRLIKSDSDILIGALITVILAIFIFYCLIKSPRRYIATLTKIDRIEDRIELKFLIKNDNENFRLSCYVKEDNPSLKRGRKFEILVKEMPIQHIKQIELADDIVEDNLINDNIRIFNSVEKYLRNAYSILIIIIPLIFIISISSVLSWISIILGILIGATLYYSYRLSIDDLYDRNIEKHERGLRGKLIGVEKFSNVDFNIKNGSMKYLYIRDNDYGKSSIIDDNNEEILEIQRELRGYKIYNNNSLVGEVYYQYGFRPKYLVRFANEMPYFIREKYNTDVYNNSVKHIDGYRIVDKCDIQNYLIKDRSKVFSKEKNDNVASILVEEIEEAPFIIEKVILENAIQIDYKFILNIFLMEKMEKDIARRKTFITIGEKKVV